MRGIEKNNKPDIGFIGAGTVGTALAVRLSRIGYRVAAVSSRTRASAQKLAETVSGCRAYEDGQGVADVSQLVFVTTPDDVIAPVVSRIRWHEGQGVVHCNGAASTDILEPARAFGAHVGAFHPLQTFASVSQAIDNIPGSTFAIEAEEPLFIILRGMVSDLGGNWVKLDSGDKVLYHTAAVFACNYLYTLVKMATDLWQTFGVPTQQATEALLPLLRGTLRNVENVGLPNCLTGPIARGDLGTIRNHLAALRRSAPGLLSTYRELGLQTIPIALAKGRIDNNRAEELEALLKEDMA